MAKNFGFDGWLLNVECAIDADQVPKLKEFVRQLTKRTREEIPNGVVIWYDSVVEAGTLSWQNEVNEHNIDMYKGTDGILLNYWWTKEHLERTVDILKNDPEEMAKVFVGIDVFGMFFFVFRSYANNENVIVFVFVLFYAGRGQTAGFLTHEVRKYIVALNTKTNISKIFVYIYSTLDRSPHQRIQFINWNFLPRMDI